MPYKALRTRLLTPHDGGYYQRERRQPAQAAACSFAAQAAVQQLVPAFAIELSRGCVRARERDEGKCLRISVKAKALALVLFGRPTILPNGRVKLIVPALTNLLATSAVDGDGFLSRFMFRFYNALEEPAC